MSSCILKLSPEECLRGLSTAEGTNEFSVYDFINHACKKEIRSSYARVTLSNLMKEGSEFREEILKSIKYRKFQDGGNKKTPTMTIKGLQKLLMILGGKVADAFRYEAFYILQRYLDGDTTMCQEIKGNKRMGSAASYQQFTEKVVKLAEEMETNEVPKVSFVYATKSAAFPLCMPPNQQNLQKTKAGTKCQRAAQLRVRRGRSETGCAPATDLPLSRTVRDRNRRATATASHGRYLWVGGQPPTRNAGTRPDGQRDRSPCWNWKEPPDLSAAGFV